MRWKTGSPYSSVYVFGSTILTLPGAPSFSATPTLRVPVSLLVCSRRTRVHTAAWSLPGVQRRVAVASSNTAPGGKLSTPKRSPGVVFAREHVTVAVTSCPSVSHRVSPAVGAQTVGAGPASGGPASGVGPVGSPASGTPASGSSWGLVGSGSGALPEGPGTSSGGSPPGPVEVPPPQATVRQTTHASTPLDKLLPAT